MKDIEFHQRNANLLEKFMQFHRLGCHGLPLILTSQQRHHFSGRMAACMAGGSARSGRMDVVVVLCYFFTENGNIHGGFLEWGYLFNSWMVLRENPNLSQSKIRMIGG